MKFIILEQLFSNCKFRYILIYKLILANNNLWIFKNLLKKKLIKIQKINKKFKIKFIISNINKIVILFIYLFPF